MHTVTCPNCRQVLNVGRCVQDARMRCKRCGQRFVGSTLDDQDASSLAGLDSGEPLPQARLVQPSATTPTAGHRPGGRRVNPLPLIFMGVLSVGIIGAAALTGWLLMNPRVEMTDPVTGRVIQRRVSRAEAERLQTERQARIAQPVVADAPVPARPQPPAPPTTGRESPPAVHSPPPVASPPTVPVTAGPGAVASGGRIEEFEASGDANIRLARLQLVPGLLGEGGHLVGAVRNTHARPVEQLELHVSLVDEHGQLMVLAPVEVRYIASGGLVSFSVPFSGLRADEVRRVRGEVGAVSRPADLVVLPIAPRAIQVTYEARAVELYGSAENTTGGAVVNARMVAGMLDAERVVGATVEGSVLGGREGQAVRVPAGRTFNFLVRHERIMPELLREFDVRLVGEQGN